MPIEDIHLALAPNPRVLLGSCAPSSAVSVAGGWWVAAVGFVVVLQRYRSCGSWACPSKSFMALVSRVTKETTCVEESIAGSGTRAEPLEAAAQSVATGISTVLLWLADAICHCFLMLALLRPSRRTRKNRSRQQSAASGC